MGEFKLLASEKTVTAIEAEEDKLKIMRREMASSPAANPHASPKRKPGRGSRKSSGGG